MPEVVAREREEDMLLVQGPPVTILDQNKAKVMFHTTQMLRQLSYYNGTPRIRRMTTALPELTMAMQTLVTMLNISGRATNFCAAMKKFLTDARGDPEPANGLRAPDLGHVKVDVFADS